MESAPLKVRIAGRAGGAIVSGLMRTTRSELVAGHEVEARIVDGGVPAIFVLWHGRLLPCSYRYLDRGLATLITRNRDGDYVTGMIESWGYRVIRGSSSRGGAVAIRDLARLLDDGVSVALTPDGPRGPRQKMKLGPLRLARRTGVPIIPVSAGASRAGWFGSWDRFLVPAPFAWCPCALGEPVYVDADADDAELRRLADRIEAELNGLTEMVDEAAGGARS